MSGRVQGGGGVRCGQSIGETDELVLRAVKDKLHVHDLHATVMHLLGVDHTKMIFNNKGRPGCPMRLLSLLALVRPPGA